MKDIVKQIEHMMKLAQENIDLCKEGDLAYEINKADFLTCDTILDMIKNQEPCQDCNPLSIEYTKNTDEKQYEVGIWQGKFLWIRQYKVFGSQDLLAINYCPHCGRYLGGKE